MRRLLPALLGLCTLAASATAREQGNAGAPPEQVTTRGPAILCGTAFAVRLAVGESIRRQPGIDFTLFYLTAADGEVMLYEGNFPRGNDDEVRTSRDFPSVIGVHDARPAEAKARSHVRDRILTGDAYRSACPRGATTHSPAWDGDFNYEVAQYTGPGTYCGGGFAIRLEAGDRVLFLDPHIDFWRMIIHVGGHQVAGFMTMVGSERGGQIVDSVPGRRLREVTADNSASYEFGDPPTTTSLTSRDFHGHAQDGWLLSRIDMQQDIRSDPACLSGSRTG
jgi:hypothetical protein